ncbi:thioredoxin-like domain-containing protein [Nocardioides terrisoli]|uniref:thioredoxin-like domain-containing protein n=1 Tax=Nocardioides terrisoli TaxID=3388267 RepID=UPI00287B8738|nr:thioredoxin-like domain-containing protein [Nocardioides marmorisolisilvae]
MTSPTVVPTLPRTRAPELIGRGWLNTDGPLHLGDLRGRWLLLDFWTFCCINCLHVLDELRPVEEAHRDALVVVGVHSPKFAHEADPVALRQAVERYGVAHPVLDDPELRTWQAYAARAWPTLVLVDPEGYVVAHYAGEGHAHAIDAMITALSPAYAERGTLQPGDSPYVAPVTEPSDLRFPAKAVRLTDGSLLVADAGHDQLVHLEKDLTAVRRVIGGFREPNGLCLLPTDVADALGSDVVVADTVGHRLVGVRLRDGRVRELAAGLNSPWDVAWWQDRLWVAMAGDHTLWTFDPVTARMAHAGGTANEGLLDGPLAAAWFAQPSGLAPDGDRLWLVDAETSALRYVQDETVHTVVGEGLFDFGFHDGDRGQARMQHPLGVAVYDGAVLVADTYNGAVRRFDPATGELQTVASGLAEPSGLVVVDDAVVVVESAAHRLAPLALASHRVEGPVSRTHRPPTEVAPGELRLQVTFAPPPGQKVDDRFGPATQLHVSATPPALLRAGDGVGTDLTRTLVLDETVGEGLLHIAARAASCDADEGEGPACRMHQQDWGIPVRLATGGPAELVLPLGGAAR